MRTWVSSAGVAILVACGAHPPAPSVVASPPASSAPASTARRRPEPSPAPPAALAPTADEYGPILPWPPVLVPTPPIALPAVSPAPFVAAGCADGAELDCTRAHGFPAGACRFGIRRNEALGALFAIAPVYECWAEDDGQSATMFHAGGMRGAVKELLVADGGRVAVLRSRAEVLARFGPPNTAEKALGFAAAFTRGSPAFDPPMPPRGVRLYVSRIEGTRVVAADGGWDVTLFSSIVFGCGLHPETALDVHVDRSGDVTTVRETPLYADPARASCVD